MSWESPINVIIGEAEAKVEGDVFKVIQHYGIDVDKGELLKALSYDRGQYKRGWSDGYAQAKEDIVCCKDCRYFGEADSKKPEYHECKYFSNWATAHYILENDYCSCAKIKDEVEE